MDGERLGAESLERARTSRRGRASPRVVTSLELLSRVTEEARRGGRRGLGPGHHRRGAPPQGREGLRRGRGARRGTAGACCCSPPRRCSSTRPSTTALLTLIDPEHRARRRRASRRGSRGRRSCRGRCARCSRATTPRPPRRSPRSAPRFPDDAELARLDATASALLAHLAETYSLSDRADPQPPRAWWAASARARLHRHVVEPPDAGARRARRGARRACARARVRGAALAGLLRRLESSPAAFAQAVRSARRSPSAAGRCPARDAKFQALPRAAARTSGRTSRAPRCSSSPRRATRWRASRRCSRRDGHRGARATTATSRCWSATGRWPASATRRARKVLICTEVGGEGRNFQFAHHLVNYDLPWSPATMEQRIGRLDRIGQTQPVEIHVFDVPGHARVRRALAAGRRGGRLRRDGGRPGRGARGGRAAPRRAGAGRRRRSARRTRDDARRRGSPRPGRRCRARTTRCSTCAASTGAAVQALVERAQRRGSAWRRDEDEALEDGLWAIARDLDERLEETVTELARRVGIGVDTDEQVDAFQCAFHFGHALKVEALPGLDSSARSARCSAPSGATPRSSRRRSSTSPPATRSSRRCSASCATGPYGRNGCRVIEQRGPLQGRGARAALPRRAARSRRTPPRGARALAAALALPGPEPAARGGDRPPGRARQASSRELLDLLAREEGRSLQGDQIRAAFPDLAALRRPGRRRGDAGGERRAPGAPGRGAEEARLRAGPGAERAWSEPCGTRGFRPRRSRRSSSRSAAITARWPRPSTG